MRYCVVILSYVVAQKVVVQIVWVGNSNTCNVNLIDVLVAKKSFDMGFNMY